MRLKEDKSSWHARGVIHKDYRHTAVDDEPKRRGANKNTSKWCKGKRGRLHDYQVVITPWLPTTSIKQLICQNCFKQDWHSREYIHVG